MVVRVMLVATVEPVAQQCFMDIDNMHVGPSRSRFADVRD